MIIQKDTPFSGVQQDLQKEKADIDIQKKYEDGNVFFIVQSLSKHTGFEM